MRNFMTVLSEGWQSLKESVSGYFMKPPTTNSAPAIPLNPIELHSFAEEALQSQALYTQLLHDFDTCCANVQALNVKKQSMKPETLEQIKKLFEDYFKVVNIAKKERNTDISNKTKNMFIKMTNLFSKENIAPSVRRQVIIRSSAKPITQSPSVSSEFNVRIANL